MFAALQKARMMIGSSYGCRGLLLGTRPEFMRPPTKDPCAVRRWQDAGGEEGGTTERVAPETTADSRRLSPCVLYFYCRDAKATHRVLSQRLFLVGWTTGQLGCLA